jgi:protein phosphatase/serine/threonine-protein phosphatase Stp1
MTGIYGKLPAHGDFVRRSLPSTFVEPWDAWLQTGLGQARDQLEGDFAALWAAAPAWHFRLPAGACGEAAVAGVMLTSHDAVGRLFPLTLAALLSPGAPAPSADWYEALVAVGQSARGAGTTVDELMGRLPSPSPALGSAGDPPPHEGWWAADGRRWALPALPNVAQFLTMLRHAPTGRQLSSQAITHRGTVRKRNEDAFVDRSDIGVWAVADGAGGHGAGDVASAAATAALADLPPGLSAAEVLAQVRLRLAAVHADLQRRASDQPDGSLLATTIVVMMIRADHFACLWAGDSRAYLLRDGALVRMTVDHSLVQEMVASGTLAPEDAESHPQANIITRAIGSQDALQLDKVAGRVEPGDRVLLCTDGLFKALSEVRIAAMLQEGCGPEGLLQAALDAGARDNVTALVVEL